MFQTIFVEPLHNILVLLVDIVPGGDVGIAIILLTILVKLVLAPLHAKAIRGQFEIKQLQPKIDAIKKQFPDKQEQAAKTFELYKKHKISPLAGCLPILIQLPIILALYRLFLVNFSADAHPLYSFVASPDVFSTNFLGILELTKRSLGLSIFAGLTQFIQAKFSAARMTPPPGSDNSMQANMSRMMGKQMQYILPIFIAFVSYQISAAIALYWSVNNIFTTIQEIIIHRKLEKHPIEDEPISAEVVEDVKQIEEK